MCLHVFIFFTKLLTDFARKGTNTLKNGVQVTAAIWVSSNINFSILRLLLLKLWVYLWRKHMGMHLEQEKK